jgi:glutamate-1-semialdehyde 2,1-aminomutase
VNIAVTVADARDRALTEAFERFRAKRPNTAAQHARAAKVMPGGNTRTVLYTAPMPIRIASAAGAVLTDIDGFSYVDLLGEYSAGIYGHSHPRIREAVNQALATGINLGAHHSAEVAFAELLCGRFDLDLVRFTNSGTEANMMALGAARAFTKRRKIMGISGGYHGGTLFFSHGGSPVNAPYEVVFAPLNDEVRTRALFREHAGDLAAVIVEPMLGGGGCLPADPSFLAMLREETVARGSVLIFDEVMTSRLHPKGLSAHLGIAPDLKTLGKYIGGGMSFGAFGGRADIMGQFDPSRPDALPHAGTFNNNTLTMTVGLAAMSEVFTPEACIHLNSRGNRLRDSLNNLFMRYQAPFRATGLGSMITIHPVAGEVRVPEDAAKADIRLKRLLYLDLLDEGYYLAERGFMALSLMIDDEHCDGLIAATGRFIERRRELFDRQ